MNDHETIDVILANCGDIITPEREAIDEMRAYSENLPLRERRYLRNRARQMVDRADSIAAEATLANTCVVDIRRSSRSSVDLYPRPKGVGCPWTDLDRVDFDELARDLSLVWCHAAHKWVGQHTQRTDIAKALTAYGFIVVLCD